jgi:MFS family permease
MGASVLCALAPSILLLAAARALQGFGGGGLMSLSQALIGEVVPPRQRGHYQGYLATVATVSSVFGPVAGGFLTEHLGWKSIFFINLPLGCIAVLMVLRLRSRPGVHHAGWSFDLAGLCYFVAFIVPVLIALERIRRFAPGSLPLILALLGVAVASFILLVRRERRAVSPLLPIDLLTQPVIWRANAMAICHGAALTSLIAFLPIYLRVVHTMTASQTGLMLVPISIGIGIGSIVTGRLVTASGYTMIYPSFGLIGATASLGAFALTASSLTQTQILILLAVAAVFMGSVMSVVQVTVQSAAGRKALGTAAGSVQFSRTVGAAFGTALMGTILFASLALSDPQATTVFGQIVDSGASVLSALEPARRAVLQADIAAAFRNAFLLVAAFTTLGIYLAWTNPSRRV